MYRPLRLFNTALETEFKHCGLWEADAEYPVWLPGIAKPGGRD